MLLSLPRILTTLAATALLAFTTHANGAEPQKSTPFHGEKVNQGTVTCSLENGHTVLTLSDDFIVPNTPAPHWRVVDSDGYTYLLQRLMIKGDKFNKSITVPSYVPNIAKVQIWCAFAEVLLGETDLSCPCAQPAKDGTVVTSTKFAGAKANMGFVTFAVHGGKRMLTLSDDFVVPETPAPHWQLVDSKGNAFLVERLKIKGDKLNKTIVVPDYVTDVASVRIWCSFAETLLGEASFKQPVL